MLSVFGVLYILVLIANGIDPMILHEDWNPLKDLRIEILMLPLSIPGLITFNRERKNLSP